MRTLILTAALAIAVAGCAKEEDEALPTGEKEPGAAAKADCPNCDPAGPGAFEQAKLDTRWYQAGDTWHVAFQFRNHGEMSRTDFIKPTQKDAWIRSEVYLFEYEAVRADRDVFGNQWRDIIEISVKQVTPSEAGFMGADSYFGAERLDRQQYKIHFRMNDLTNALDVTYFNREYPHGRTVLAPTLAALTIADSVFPVNVPRLLVNAPDVIAPELPAALADLSAALGLGFENKTFKKFDFDNGDVVLWEPGYLWPAYVENAQGRGLLLDGMAN